MMTSQLTRNLTLNESLFQTFKCWLVSGIGIKNHSLYDEIVKGDLPGLLFTKPEDYCAWPTIPKSYAMVIAPLLGIMFHTWQQSAIPFKPGVPPITPRVIDSWAGGMKS